jgi:hypothetical protein
MIVIPAKAGIHFALDSTEIKMDSGFCARFAPEAPE